MHGSSACCKAGVRIVSNEWETCIRAFMDFEKAYTIDRHGMWQVLRVYGI